MEAIENTRTGERITFVASDADALVMISRWTRAGHRAAEHIHPGMEERFEVLSGSAAFLVDGQRCDAHEGDVVTVPAGVRHLAWNPGDAEVRLRIEMRPPLRWEEFTRRLFAGERPDQLLAEYSAEICLPIRPTRSQIED